ncbi:cell division control protein 45 homolog isoform X1 [Dysidea avara]|uniref:cell division control protein 45 homolog isoform X1 n=1 Tax=Dysidea avara TaxID=196820 RepID=UPI0033227EE9
MIIERLKEDFYVKIKHERVLLLVSLEVDSLCCAKILQLLFKNDDIRYTLVPVSGKTELREAYAAHVEESKCVVMVNCGGCFNILELLQPTSDVKFYIIDSYRPLLLENIYNHGQVNILIRAADATQLSIPEFEEVFAYLDESDSDDDEYFSDEDSGPQHKRRKTGSFEERKRKQLWKKRKQEVMYKYNEFHYHETAASLVVYDLAWKMSKDNNDILWWAILGLTDQYVHHKIDQERYINDIGELQQQVLRHNRTGDDDAASLSVNSLKITFDNELRLLLYRHWTLYDSLCHSAYTACRFRVWTTKGQKKLQEFLAEMGLPLVQCKQKFCAMDKQFKENLRDWIIEHARKYSLDDICYGSFTAQFGFKNKFCAVDVVSGVAALMEQNSQECSLNFLKALDALSRGNVQQLISGLEIAKQQQTAIVSQARSFTEMKQFVCYGPFVFACVEQGTLHSELFSRPIALAKLARFFMETSVITNKKARSLPFLLSAPLSSKDGTCILIALPPYADDSCKNEFGRAFQQAALRLNTEPSFDFFNAAIVTLKVEERGTFLNALTALYVNN